MTKIADYYCALPILSAALTGALFGSPLFNRSPHPFTKISYDLIFTAEKLRHAALFCECFVHIVGTRVDGPSPGDGHDLLESDPELRSMISTAHVDLCRMLLEFNQELFMVVLSDGNIEWKQNLDSVLGPTQNAKLYRHLKHEIEDGLSPSDYPHLFQALGELFKNNHAFDQTGFGAGQGPYSRYFLCANIEDEDMPWDSSEVDF